MVWQSTFKERFKIKKAKFQKNKFCHYCGIEMWMDFSLKKEMGGIKQQATLDHIIPRGNGGNDNPNNMVLCCSFCNAARGRIDYDTFKKASVKGKQHVNRLQHQYKLETSYKSRLKRIAIIAYI